MAPILPFIVIGLTSGSVYALGGVGLVLTYKTSQIFNFAYGAIATVGAYVFYALHVQGGVPWPVAALISVVGVGVVLGYLFEPFARVLARRSLAMRVAATVGLLVLVQAFFIILYGNNTNSFPQFLPTSTFKLFGAFVGVNQVITFAFVLIATAVLYAGLRFTRTGVAMRGVVDNSDLLDLAGTSPRRVRRAAWLIGCIFAAASGLLIAPSIDLSASALTLLIVQAFGAAAIGAFTSLPITYLGGLAVGILGSVLTDVLSSTTSTVLVGIPPSVPFIVLFVALLVLPKRWLATSQRIVPVRSTWSAPAPVQIVGAIAALVGLAIVPQVVGVRLTDWTLGLCFMILFLSLGLLVRTSGQVSLSHLSFAAVGAGAFSHFAINLGIPWVPALLLAGLVAVPIGMMLAIPAIRLGGIYLALATFGFGLALSQMFYGDGQLLFGSGGVNEPRPHLGFLDLQSDKGFYYVVLVIAVIAAIAVVVLTRTRLGRLLRAMADSPLALETSGTNVNVMLVLVFSISAFIAAIAGALIGGTFQIASGDLFDPISSLVLIALILVVVGAEPWYAGMAAAAYTVIPAYLPGGNVAQIFQIIFGASAVIVALVGMPQAPDRVHALIDRIGGAGWRPRRRRQPPVAGGRVRVATGSLEIDAVQVRFGGVLAVDQLSLTAPTGRITGLIGPNGAGKTTTFNACSGLVRPASGRVLLDGRDITARSPSRRARLGVGRTFQQMELFDALSVRENVGLGYEASLAGANPLTQVLGRPAHGGQIATAVAEALELCGIGEIAETPAGSLSTGQRRLVELARCLAGPYRILLLDEPSSGLDRHESEQFGRILQRIVDERGVGILLVEHDMSLVMSVCEHIYVLDFGVPIFDGTPGEIIASPIVQAAYLGESDDQALAESA